jgi:hypothetical protein
MLELQHQAAAFSSLNAEILPANKPNQSEIQTVHW